MLCVLCVLTLIFLVSCFLLSVSIAWGNLFLLGTKLCLGIPICFIIVTGFVPRL